MRTAILVALVILGVVTAAFPSVAKCFEGKVQQRVGSSYSLLTDNVDAAARFSAAEQYNREFPGDTSLAYEETLALEETDVAGRVLLPKVQVDLPIYLGADSRTLEKGVGHVPESHLPVGGDSTHCVLSAHTGLPFASMFDPLPSVEVGDEMIVEVLGRELAYEVTSTVVVLPEDVADHLDVRAGQDLLTLLTCTPYGVNTHRLLVTGERTDDPVYKVPLKGHAHGIAAAVVMAVGLGGFGSMAFVGGRYFTRNRRGGKHALRANGPALDKLDEPCETLCQALH